MWNPAAPDVTRKGRGAPASSAGKLVFFFLWNAHVTLASGPLVHKLVDLVHQFTQLFEGLRPRGKQRLAVHVLGVLVVAVALQTHFIAGAMLLRQVQLELNAIVHELAAGGAAKSWSQPRANGRMVYQYLLKGNGLLEQLGANGI